MPALILAAAALAAQAATSANPPTSTEPAKGPKLGQSTYLDIEGGVGYSSNPSLTIPSRGGAFGRISLHAVHARVSARSTTVLSGYVSNSTYTSHHRSQQSLSVDARHDVAVSERLRLFGDAEVSFDKGGQLDTRFLGVPNVPPPPGGPGTPPVLLPPGSDFLSVTGRTYHLGAHGGGQLALSANDSLTFSSGVDHTVFRGGGQRSEFTTIPASLGYARQISPRANVGVRLAYQHTDYDGPNSVQEITPELTGRLLLSEQLVLSGAVGVSFASTDNGVTTRHSTGLSAQADLCQTGERTQFCGRFAVDQQTATTAGPAKSLSAGIDYSRRLDADSTIQFSLAASHYSSPIFLFAGPTFSKATYYRAAADYSRRISDRWFGGVDVAARKVTQSGPDPKADVSGSLFVRYRFGDLQ